MSSSKNNNCMIKDENNTTKIENNDERQFYKPTIKWLDLTAQIFIHAGAIYGLYLMFIQAKLLTSFWAFFVVYASGFGITAGAHRLWSHRAYKAKWPLRLILIILFTISGQKDVHAWALDHRVHHKYSETDSDPHNVKRGFFFAHVGWLILTPHPDVVEKRKNVDLKDLDADQIVMWQKRLYIPLFGLLTIGLPVFLPVYYWNEDIWTSFWVNFNFRFCVTLNMAFFVNSAAHMWGGRPYDKNITPTENLTVSIATLGEGWHNYHHVFPWDYKTSELGDYSLNITTGFIDAFANIGWAYDRKYVSSKMIKHRATKNGDGSYNKNIWGYGDKDITTEDHQELEKMLD
ncbi:hypothetical protein HCN44_000484 [Aphidius gifuensis]|uniref:Fatty acid desaturase domain-containing protein n=1 Tax=Aphidius gifuensis TaxID=684658 RepID=A0A835CPI6_APHGI|nr:acyl-CoA Delta-9 desaturase-like [Aphidius gifuensis]KAF7990679.1 hypothetical protein HCN44_000484 [Aphidius gifuensis]